MESLKRLTSHPDLPGPSQLGLSDRLHYHTGDVFDPKVADTFAETPIDFLVADFGAANRLAEFWATWWPRVAEGGHLVVHR